MVRLILLLAFASVASAAVRLPGGGYVRPNQYTAVVVDGPATLGGPELVTTVAKSRGVVPLLVTGPATTLIYDGGSIPLTPLRPGERLIGVTGPVPADLFGRDKNVLVRLDPVDPLPGPPAAWTGLDAVVVDAPAWGRVPAATVDTLLAAGVRVVIVGPDRPAPRPSRPILGGWELLAPPSTPVDVVSLDVYSPTRFWDDSPLVSVRRMALGVVMLTSAAITAAVAFRKTRTAVLVSLSACVGFVAFHHFNGRRSAVAGDVYVTDELTRRDRFSYERNRDAFRRSFDWTGDARPVFSSRAAMTAADFRLVVDGDRTSFDYGGTAGSTQCFLVRSFEPAPQWTPGHADSPADDLAKLLYESHEIEPVGRVDHSPWAGVLIARRH